MFSINKKNKRQTKRDKKLYKLYRVSSTKYMITICKWTYMSYLKAALGGPMVLIPPSSCWRMLALLLSVRITELSTVVNWLGCGLLRSLSLYTPREWKARRLLIGTPRWIIAANCWRRDCSSRTVSTRTLISFLRPVRILKKMTKKMDKTI